VELLLKKSSLMCGDDKKAEELSIWMVPRREEGQYTEGSFEDGTEDGTWKLKVSQKK